MADSGGTRVGRAVGIQGYVTKEEHLQTSDEEGAAPPSTKDCGRNNSGG